LVSVVATNLGIFQNKTLEQLHNPIKTLAKKWGSFSHLGGVPNSTVYTIYYRGWERFTINQLLAGGGRVGAGGGWGGTGISRLLIINGMSGQSSEWR